MSLYKAIEHHKEHRKQYHGAKLVSKSCRNHGSCGYCRNNRLHNYNVKLIQIKDLENDKYLKDEEK
jgi:hypothetical protein